ncbi:MAG: 1-deoxy-D-xylulose-5-phosphate synthase [Lachnospiraceae bacterium]|nr:1-deoxy-D-xylulose-5-phosphate synthase [Lachnospiraceae bacterium]
MALLDSINNANDIKNIDRKDYPALAEEIRTFLIDKISENGGHLASNLGAVELTMALHLCMDFPKDKLIFDVGHQAYTHKLLTGRKADFDELRKYGGMSGFPKACESDCDAFNTGHSSTSISAAMGYAVARDIRHSDEKVACVIGDGSLTGGMAYEAINSLAQTKNGCVIILNDNDMSIDKNVGGLSTYLSSIRVGDAYNGLKTGVENSLLSTKTGEKVAKVLKRSKDNIKQFFVKGSFLEELGITYVGPIDGHDTETMVSIFKQAFKLNKPIIVHVKTKKGKGYRFAERHPDYFHGISSFDKDTGHVIKRKETRSNTDIFGEALVKLGDEHEDVVAVTAAMSIGTGVYKFAEKYPDRCFDVGIAEQHAVTFAAGMAKAHLVPYVAVYSSFLQRAYDQILHDVCMQKLHVVFAIDRSGLVGQDGETHQGIYDISYLSHMPDMVVMAPKNRYELREMIRFAYEYDGPIAIKYSRGDAYKGLKEFETPIEAGKSEVIYRGSRLAIFACGNMVEEAVKLYERLKKDGVDATLVNVRFVSSVDIDLVRELLETHNIILTMEENITKGGYGELLAAEIIDNELDRGKNIIHVDGSIKQEIVPHGSIDVLRDKLGISADKIYESIKPLLDKE